MVWLASVGVFALAILGAALWTFRHVRDWLQNDPGDPNELEDKDDDE